MRRLSLNLLTLSATALILVGLAMPAVEVHRRLVRPPSLPVPAVRTFGLYIDPWHIDDWAANVGAQPTMAATFESFSRKRTLLNFTRQAERRGFRSVLISWEPWKPVPTRLGLDAQRYPQPGYRNVDIANGSQDSYIWRFAQQLATFDGTVYLRYAHEMNGFWYPWSWDAYNYRRAWRRIHRLVDAAGAHNVRFVWSANLNLYEGRQTWIRNAKLYWPGRKYVDVVGSTMINFGGSKDYAVARFAPRLRMLHSLYRRPMMLTEVNTQYGGRVPWLRDLRRMLRSMPWVEGVAWSQLPSRGAAHLRNAGDLHWDVRLDPKSSWIVRGIVDDGLTGARAYAARSTAKSLPAADDAAKDRAYRATASSRRGYTHR